MESVLTIICEFAATVAMVAIAIIACKFLFQMMPEYIKREKEYNKSLEKK